MRPIIPKPKTPSPNPGTPRKIPNRPPYHRRPPLPPRKHRTWVMKSAGSADCGPIFVIQTHISDEYDDQYFTTNGKTDIDIYPRLHLRQAKWGFLKRTQDYTPITIFKLLNQKLFREGNSPTPIGPIVITF